MNCHRKTKREFLSVQQPGRRDWKVDMNDTLNVDPAELKKFDELASRWWDPEGEFKPLHRMNPVRLAYLQDRVNLAGKRCLDIGCGGGLLTEAMARAGADVTGIDLATAPLDVARMHLEESGLHSIRYIDTSAEALTESEPASFDVITCMEVLEHVPDPAQLVAACRRLAKPGAQVFFSTINRNPKAFLLAIVAAEYILGLLPRGTHEYARLIKPSELNRWSLTAGLQFRDLTGLHFNPLNDSFSLTDNVDVNYLIHFAAPE
jgi:2-polyprenyl-6-hydroxyphenyl methylase/3-demethylubiquinone-9 3-methyltransferase